MRMVLWGVGLTLIACTPSTDDSITDTNEQVVWEWCPAASEYEGDLGWDYAIDVTDDALYCASFYERRTLEAELEMKGKMRWLAGRYPLPLKATDKDIALPICFSLASEEPPMMQGTGTVTSSVEKFGDNQRLNLQIEQPFATAKGREFTLTARLTNITPSSESFESHVMDGRASSLMFDGPVYSIDLCDVGAEDCEPKSTWSFGSCDGLDYELQTHVVVFDGGQVT